MKLNIIDKPNSYIILSDEIFYKNFNEPLLHQVLVSYLSNRRQNTKLNKNRSKVSGSNIKPWKQKGTGRARSGSKKSPIWRSGGVTFGGQVISYKNKINKKMYNAACKIILSNFIKNNKLLLFSNFSIEFPKTKLLVKKLSDLKLSKNVIIIIHNEDNNIIKASKNLYKINTMNIFKLNLIDIINFDTIIITVDSIKYIEGILK